MVLVIEDRKSINLIENVMKDMRDIKCYDTLGIKEPINKYSFKTSINIVYDANNRKFISNNDSDTDYSDKNGYYFPVTIFIRGNSNLHHINRRYIANNTDPDLIKEMQNEIKPYIIRDIKKSLDRISKAITNNDSLEITALYSLGNLDKSYLNSECIFEKITVNNFNTTLFLSHYDLNHNDIDYLINKDLSNSNIISLLNLLCKDSKLNDLPIIDVHRIYNKVYRSAVKNNCNLNERFYESLSKYMNVDIFSDLMIFIFEDSKSNINQLTKFISSIRNIKLYGPFYKYLRKQTVELNSSYIMNELTIDSSFVNVFKEIKALDIYSIAHNHNVFTINTDRLKEYNVTFNIEDINTLRTYINSSLGLLKHNNKTSKQIDELGCIQYLQTHIISELQSN